MTLRIIFSPEAQADLISLYDYIAEQSREARALAYIAQIEAYSWGSRRSPPAGVAATIFAQACGLWDSNDA